MKNHCEGFSSETHQTLTLWRSRRIRQSMAQVTSYILENYFDPTDDMIYEINKGSVRIHSSLEEIKVNILVFIDFGRQLADKFKIVIHDDPAVVAIDFSSLPSHSRNLLRDELSKWFKFYMDPRNQHLKIQMKPDYEHCYDIIFLERGNCERSEMYERALQEINEAIEKHPDWLEVDTIELSEIWRD